MPIVQRIAIIGSSPQAMDLFRHIAHINADISLTRLDFNGQDLLFAQSHSKDSGAGLEDAYDTAHIIARAQLIVIAENISRYQPLFQAIGLLLKPETLLTDIAPLNHIECNDLPQNTYFIPAHPNLPDKPPYFTQDQFCFLSPFPQTSLHVIETVSHFWETCGFRIEIMDAVHHDSAVTMAQQMPVIAYHALYDSFINGEHAAQIDEAIKLDVSPLKQLAMDKDFDKQAFIDTLLHSKAEAANHLEDYINALTALRKSIRRGDRTYIETILNGALKDF